MMAEDSRLPAQLDFSSFLRVVVAVIVDDDGRVLVTRRPEHVHQGGLWEFPGGKVESGETVREALRREIDEELGVAVEDAWPLLQIPHCYPDRNVLLDVWHVERFSGTPHGREGQPLRWVTPAELSSLSFPAANAPIITAALLPDRYLITPEPGDTPAFLAELEKTLQGGVRLVQLRAKQLSPEAYLQQARESVALCHRYGARLLVNGEPDWVAEVGADGLHLSSKRLMAYERRPLGSELLVAASCHSEGELRQAERIGVDFAVVSPVLPTQSHPEAMPLGWEGLRRFTEVASIPVYALGGMGNQHIPQVRACYAQGIAAIRGLWEVK